MTALSPLRIAALLDHAALAHARDETPFLAYDLSIVAESVLTMRQAFAERVALRYAVKCNPDERVLRTVMAAGGGFEIASAAELELVRDIGAPLGDVLYSNPVKPPAHVRAAHVAGVRRFAVDSHAELTKVATYAAGAEVFVRVRVDDSSSRFPLSSKFGTSLDEARRLLLEAGEVGLVAAGLTFHVGSQCTDVGAWAHAVRWCGPLLEDLASAGLPLPLLDLGGGFPAFYGDEHVPTIEAIAHRTLEALDALPYCPPEVVCEPGRALVAAAATMVTSVIGRTEREGRHWVYLDVGAYNGLMEAAQSRGRMAFPLTSDCEGGETMRCTVTGPSCDSSDTLLVDADLPNALQVGDRVAIGCAGAYSSCYAAPFNGFPVPVPVYLD